MARQVNVTIKPLIDAQVAVKAITNVDGISRVRQVFPDEVDDTLRRLLVVDVGDDTLEKAITGITDLQIAEDVTLAPIRRIIKPRRVNRR